eukprot:m.93145 g.93145  ORF g.93145 m.93145 type:complete len:89 (-) comp51192_c0_seq4:1314-1580(-)
MLRGSFTKFLLDRSGAPCKRYEPHEPPFSFEKDILELLSQAPPSTVAAQRLMVDASTSPMKALDTMAEAVTITPGFDSRSCKTIQLPD